MKKLGTLSLAGLVTAIYKEARHQNEEVKLLQTLQVEIVPLSNTALGWMWRRDDVVSLCDYGATRMALRKVSLILAMDDKEALAEGHVSQSELTKIPDVTVSGTFWAEERRADGGRVGFVQLVLRTKVDAGLRGAMADENCERPLKIALRSVMEAARIFLQRSKNQYEIEA